MIFNKLITIVKQCINFKFFYTYLFLAHAILLAFLAYKFGLNTLNEGDKYLTEALEFTKGNFGKAFEYQTLYAAYIIYLSVFVALKIPPEFIILSTYLISLLAYYKFYVLLSQLKSIIYAKIWLSLMLLSPLIQYWHFNLFSESFFIAICLLAIYITFYENVTHRVLKLTTILLILVFTRPLGVLLSSFILLFYFNHQKIIKSSTLYKLIFVLSVLTATYFLFFYRLHFLGMASQIMSGAIYFGFPTLNNQLLKEGNYTLYQCYQFIYQHYGSQALLSVWWQKLSSFFVLTRPYYSSIHNYFNAAHYLFYGLALITLVNHRFKKSVFKKLNSIILLYVLASLAMVGLFYNEWSERYTVVVFPFIFVISIQGIYIALKKIDKLAV